MRNITFLSEKKTNWGTFSAETISTYSFERNIVLYNVNKNEFLKSRNFVT